MASSVIRTVMMAAWVCSCLCVNIAGLDRALIVLRLYKNAGWRQQVLFLPATGGEMGYEEARGLVGKWIDCYDGRWMQIKVPAEGEGDEMDTELYNSNNGYNLAEELVATLRAGSAAQS